jgi:hypothetical protein
MLMRSSCSIRAAGSGAIAGSSHFITARTPASAVRGGFVECMQILGQRTARGG